MSRDGSQSETGTYPGVSHPIFKSPIGSSVPVDVMPSHATHKYAEGYYIYFMDYTIGCFAAFCLLRRNMRPTARFRKIVSNCIARARKTQTHTTNNKTKSVGVVFDLDGVIYRNSPTGTFVIPGPMLIQYSTAYCNSNNVVSIHVQGFLKQFNDYTKPVFLSHS